MDISSYIEHTLLKPNTTITQINQLCEEANTYNFAGVCVPPYYVNAAQRKVIDSNTRIITVVGYPMGYSAISSKVEETKKSVDDGADEIDMVVNIAAVLDKNWSYVRNDIDSVTRATHLKGKVVKVILETGLISINDLKQLCQICMDIGVDYIKTSTGINGSGATVEIIQQIKKYLIGSNLKIKASGGIRTKEFATALLDAGANRLGTSASLAIVGKEPIIK